ncbi:hypothetical protein R3P38DRAFT_3213608 [Favolaschia claudopus]|uniref:Uncharacterized protein n=1 Tax=Favolaschia claudopus TaxID=2862362 RepID=A0AAW0ADW6_9AGAR
MVTRRDTDSPLCTDPRSHSRGPLPQTRLLLEVPPPRVPPPAHLEAPAPAPRSSSPLLGAIPTLTPNETLQVQHNTLRRLPKLIPISVALGRAYDALDARARPSMTTMPTTLAAALTADSSSCPTYDVIQTTSDPLRTPHPHRRPPTPRSPRRPPHPRFRRSGYGCRERQATRDPRMRVPLHLHFVYDVVTALVIHAMPTLFSFNFNFSLASTLNFSTSSLKQLRFITAGYR